MIRPLLAHLLIPGLLASVPAGADPAWASRDVSENSGTGGGALATVQTKGDETEQIPVTITFRTRVVTAADSTTCQSYAIGIHDDPIGLGQELQYRYSRPVRDRTPPEWTGLSEDIAGDRITYTAGFAGRFSFQPDGECGDLFAQHAEAWAGIEVVAEYTPPSNPPPTACFTFGEADEPLTLDFDGSCSSDPNGEVVAYRWTFEGPAIQTGSGERVSLAWDEPGQYTVGLAVTDDEGASSPVVEQQVEVEPADIDVLLSVTSRAEQVGEQLIAVFEIGLTNVGKEEAKGVLLSTVLPKQLHFLSTLEDGSDPLDCQEPSTFVGGRLTCTLDLAGSEDPFGRNVRFVELRARITNAAELEPLELKATVRGERDPSDNEDRANPRDQLDLAGGSVARTRELMRVLEPYFDYETDINQFGDGASTDRNCRGWQSDSYNRFEQIREEHPEAFANLAYGPITSGNYTTVVGTDAGHVGLVVYEKGTDFRRTGIVIHGLPSPSPIGVDPELFNTQVGTRPLGDPPEPSRYFWTSYTGLLYRTPAVDFPGSPGQEGDGCGFEGLYVDNGDEFRGTQRPACTIPAATTCPIAPEAVVINTESPVDLRITNKTGEQLFTDGDLLDATGFPSSLSSIAYPHGDGTFGWNLTLPEDDYIVELIGSANGPYRLTMMRFNVAGEDEIIETVIDGVAAPGVEESFEFIDTIIADGFEVED